jgi:hypothetical protein
LASHVIFLVLGEQLGFPLKIMLSTGIQRNYYSSTLKDEIMLEIEPRHEVTLRKLREDMYVYQLYSSLPNSRSAWCNSQSKRPHKHIQQPNKKPKKYHSTRTFQINNVIHHQVNVQDQFIMWKCVQDFEKYCTHDTNNITSDGLIRFLNDLGFVNIFHV